MIGKSSLTIGKLAARAGVGVETVRFYERKGLLERPPKGSGFRIYPDESVRRLHLIRRCKELGFSLQEISDLLALRIDRSRGCVDVRQEARQKIGEISERIAHLQEMQAALDKLARRCRGNGPTSECPLLDALEDVEFSVFEE